MVRVTNTHTQNTRVLISGGGQQEGQQRRKLKKVAEEGEGWWGGGRASGLSGVGGDAWPIKERRSRWWRRRK